MLKILREVGVKFMLIAILFLTLGFVLGLICPNPFKREIKVQDTDYIDRKKQKEYMNFLFYDGTEQDDIY